MGRNIPLKGQGFFDKLKIIKLCRMVFVSIAATSYCRRTLPSFSLYIEAKTTAALILIFKAAIKH